MNIIKPKFWDKKQISFFSVVLFPIAILIKFLSFLKRRLVSSNQFSIPIICIGNIYLGGTGKTPLCIEIYSILKELNFRPAFIRKKYESFKDEVNLQEQTGRVYESKKRSIAIKNAIKNNSNIAILDDGFQDFSIKKNLSIVCFNERQWIGNGLTIPSGPLRENISALKRANCVIINGKKNTDIEKEIIKENKKIKIFYTKYRPENIDKYKSKKVIAFAGIGNPINFFNLLKENNIDIIEEIEYPDHHIFSNNEIENLINKSKNTGATLLTTEKDQYRINQTYKKFIDYIKIKVEIENRKEFVNEIKKII